MGVATRYKVPGWSGAGGMAEGNMLPTPGATRFAQLTLELHFRGRGLCSRSHDTFGQCARIATDLSLALFFRGLRTVGDCAGINVDVLEHTHDC